MWHKKLTAYLLLIVFVYTSLGCYVSFFMQQQKIHKEIKCAIRHGLPDNCLTKISVAPNSSESKLLVWVKPGEFKYRGMMFDVVRKTTDEKGVIHYYCINDKQEKKIIDNLEKYFANNDLNTSHQNKSKSIYDFIKKLNNYTMIDGENLVLLSSNKSYTDLFVPLNGIAPSVPTPPPDKV